MSSCLGNMELLVIRTMDGIVWMPATFLLTGGTSWFTVVWSSKIGSSAWMSIRAASVFL